MAVDVQIRFKAEAQQAQREVKTLRSTLAQLNQTLAEQKNRLIGATAEEQKNIRASIAANQAMKATIRSRIEQANLQKQAIAQTMKEARERERAAQQQIRASQQMSAAQRAVVQELTVGARVVYQQLSQLTGGFVRAAADMETFRNTVNVVTRDAAETNRILGDLLKLTVELVGIDTRDLINYAGRLMAAGLSADQAITAIRGVTKTIAEQGRSTAETRHAMEQIVQSFNTGRAVMFDFRTLMRLMPRLWDDISNALGENVRSTEDFNRAAEAAGGHTQALITVLTEMDRASQGANLDTIRAQWDILIDLSRVLAAELGEHLVPTIVAVLKEINRWIDRFRNMDDRAQAAIAWAAALATALTGLVTVVGTATLGFGALSASLSAMTGASGIAALAAGVGGLTAALAAAAPYIAVGGIIIGGIALLAKAIDDTSESARILSIEITRLDKVTQVYNLTTGQLEQLTTAQANSYANFRERVKTTQDEIQSLSTRLQENRVEQEKLNEALNNVSSPDAFLVLEKDLENVIAKEQELVAELDEATNKLQGLRFEVVSDEAALTKPIESLEEQIVRTVDEILRLRDAFKEVSRSGEIQEIQDAASNLTEALKRELELQLQDTELTAAERLDLELSYAREVERVNREAQGRITEINEENAEKQQETSKRQAEARIEAAERARAVEVAANQAAAASGASYAEQLASIANVSQRQEFADLVNSFVEQGLSFDEARAKAEPYLSIFQAIPAEISASEAAFGSFSSTLVNESNRSADAVVNLVNAVDALAISIGERLPDATGSLERSLLNEQRFFEQNPIGLTIEEDQRRAGEAGRQFVNALFRRQDREADREDVNAAKEAARELNEMASAIDSVVGELGRFEGDIGTLANRIGQFDIAGLASGNPASIATLPFQLYDAFTFDQRQAAARLPELDRQNREAFERGEFGIPTDLLQFGRGQLDIAAETVGRSGFGGRQLLELLEGLDPAIGHTTLDEVATIPDRIIETIQGFTDQVLVGLQEELDQATFNLDFAKQTGGDVQSALQAVIAANTELYQTQIDSYNAQRLATGRAIGNVEELNRILNALNNETRLQLPSGPQNAQQFLAQQGITRGLAEPTDDQERGLTTEEIDALAPVIESVNEGIETINAAILSIETRIDQSNDPSEIAQLLSQVPELIRQKYEMLRKALEARLGAGEITEAVFNASLSELQSNQARDLERHSDAVLVNTVRAINEDVQRIDASITEIQTQIEALSEPDEIVALLSEIPGLLTEKYQKLRDALDAQYAAGEISVDVYNASLSELQSNQAQDLERHSDAVLANTVRAINEDVQRIDASITEIQTQIEALSEPDEIVALLSEIPGLLTEKYQKLRDALDARYAAGEISVDVYNASLTALGNSEAADIERQSDAVLAQTIGEIDDNVDLIDANIGALQLTVSQTDDPEVIAGLLEAIKALVMDKYVRLRERLDALYAAEEISTTAYNASLTALGTAETTALANIDTQALQAISDDAQAQVNLINGSIENLRLSLQLTEDPAEIRGILDAIKVLTGTRFDILIQELKDIRETLGDEEYAQALKGLELGKQVALDNIDTEKFSAISAEAQKQADFINGSIENLRLSFQLTDDPTEQQQILDAIKVLTASRFKILRDELIKIKETLDPEEYAQALKGIDLGEQLAVQNLDTEKFSVISAEAQKQVDLINGNIENLRLSLQLTDDSTEQQDILTAIKVLTAARFDVLREELIKIKDSLDTDVYNQALRGLNLGEQLAIQNLDTEKLNLISVEAQKQVDAINGSIENLRLSFELSDDPAERQQILDSIKILTAARFDVLRNELEKIKDSLDDGEYERALKGLNLGEQVALKNLDTEKFEVISGEAQKQVELINGSIENLRLSLQLTDDPNEIQQILDAIKILTAARFDILIQELKDIRETLGDEEYAQALKGLELGKQIAVENIDTEKFGAISAEAQKQVDAINVSIENLRLSLQITDDPTEIQQILDAIKLLTAARFDTLIEELKELRDSFDNAEDFNRALRGLELGKTIALDNINTEKFDAVSAEAQKQADFISGSIDNLRLALQLTDDPAEVQAILNSIKILTAARFDVLIQGLKDIENSFDDPAVFAQALEGLELGKAVALRGIDTESIGVTLAGIGEQISETDSEITQLFDELGEQTTAAGVRAAIQRLHTAITTKYQLMRNKINESADTEEDKAKQIVSVNFQEGQALDQLGESGLGQFNSLVDTSQFLFDNATEENFAVRRQAFIDAINTFYDERIAFINGLDLSDTDRANMLEVVRIQREVALGAVPEMHRSVEERLELEQELQADIQDLRDETIEAEADRLERIADLQLDHNRRILDLEEELQRDLEDLRRARFDDARDDALDYTRDLEDLQNQYARKLFGDSIISFGDLTEQQRQQLQRNDEFRRGLFDINLERDRETQDRIGEFGILTPGSSGYQFYREQLLSGELTGENLIRNLFGTQGLEDFLGFERGTEDAEQRLAQGIIDATTVYETVIAENTVAIQTLTGQLSITASTPPTALGNPVAGLAVGQAVGGLVEQGANELFHFEQTDAIARRLARQAAHRQPRQAPNYLPTPDQLRNARDVGREVVAGFTEGLQQRGELGGDSRPQPVSFPEELRADIHLNFSDGTVQVLRDQVVRLDQQGRTL